jgi:hypothetical protein
VGDIPIDFNSNFPSRLATSKLSLRQNPPIEKGHAVYSSSRKRNWNGFIKSIVSRTAAPKRITGPINPSRHSTLRELDPGQGKGGTTFDDA